MWPKLVLVLGIIVFGVGFSFIGKSYGEAECTIPDRKNLNVNPNYNGGLAGTVIGLIITALAIGMLIAS